MENVNNLNSAPEIGKYYLVDCVKYKGRWCPVLGSAHSDPDLNFVRFHFHYDIRFLSENHFNELGDFTPVRNKGLTPGEKILGKVIVLSEIEGQRELRQKLCRRDQAIFPVKFEVIHKKFCGAKVICGKCPHKGYALSSITPDEHGMIICPGHGLQIDTNTQEVVDRPAAHRTYFHTPTGSASMPTNRKIG